MDYKKIIEEYQTIQSLYGDCKNSHKERSKKLLRDIKESLHGKSSQEYSKYFSEMFDMWLVATKEETSSTSHQKPLTHNKKTEVSKLIDFSSISHANKLHEEKKIIEYILGVLWEHILQNKLMFFIFKEDNKNYKYTHKNWPLYELLNQISNTINQIVHEGKSKEIKNSSLSQDDKEDVIANTEELCQHILETYILGLKQSKKTSIKWFPELKTNKDIQLPHIIATSDLVSYMFDYKLMSTKKRNNYLKDAKNCVENIYNKLINGNILYNAIESYINENDKEDIVVEYKKHLLSPRTVFIFIISIIQEVVRKTLTQNRNNIFYTINKNFRDTGISEEALINKIKKDAKAYMQILYYLEKPVSVTIKNKEKKLKEWFKELEKLRYGIFDDYLSTLDKATKISFDETVKTSIKTS